MLNIIWCALIIVSVVYSAYNGTVADTTTAMLQGAGQAVEFVLSVGAIMALWSGIMEICEQSGLSRWFARLLKPFIRLLFSTKNEKSQKAIAMNMTANILGLSNAATPLGIEAMKLLNEENIEKNKASNDMCMLAVINSASIQIIPSTLIAIREMMGSENPTEIIVPVWITSILVFVFGILAVKAFSMWDRGGIK